MQERETMTKCENCVYYNAESGKCSRNLNPVDCTEFKDIYEYWAEAYDELCEWACENDVYDDVTSMCECWEEYEEDWEDYWEEDE